MNRTQLLTLILRLLVGSSHGVHHANVGGFVKASSLLLKDCKKEPWYEVPLLRCKSVHIPKLLVATAWTWQPTRAVSKSLHRNFENHVRERDSKIFRVA